ncbi:MAG: hypothetical protein K8S99_03300 [Planctomycetes bacterium]|nr:hypothetical protein [Planctomycetota bacterium]
MNRRNLLSPVLIVAVAWITGCDEEPVRVYQAPKETRRADTAVAPSAIAAVDDGKSGEADLEWTLPEGWRQQPNTSAMRYATFAVGEGAECTVVALGPDAADILANVNRWRAQMGLPPTTEQALPASIAQIKIADSVATLVDLQAADGGARMLACIIPRGGRVWFFKLTGDSKIVEPQKRAFGGLIASLKFVNAATPAVPRASGEENPQAARPTGMPVAIETWSAPPSWRLDPSPKAPRLAAFQLGQGNETAEVTLIAFPGNAGGPLENINRWRGQVGLPPVSDLSQQPLEKINIDADAAVLLDLTGPDTQPPDKQRMVVILLARGDQSWFFKMMGSGKLVSDEKARFEAFVRSIRFKG